jgi:predicted secreted hydrolase
MHHNHNTELKAALVMGLTLLLGLAVAACAGRNGAPMNHAVPVEPAAIPRDLAAHEWAQLEWWYYTGHLQDENGERYGFELTFFRRRIEDDRIHGLPIGWVARTAFIANFALTEERTGKYWRAANFAVTPGNGGALFDRYQVTLWDWSAHGDDQAHFLKAQRGAYALELELKPLKPPALHGRGGIVRKDEAASSYYTSYTDMEAKGRLRFAGRELKVSGAAWFDHEWGNMGTVTSTGWDWFSLQLDDGAEYMIYAIHAPGGGYTRFSAACRIDQEGTEECIPLDNVTITPLAWWRSHRSRVVYPVGWRLAIPGWGLDVTVFAILPDQEFSFLNLFYWEGSCLVLGKPASGRAYVELSAYKKNWIYSLHNGEPE